MNETFIGYDVKKNVINHTTYFNSECGKAGKYLVNYNNKVFHMLWPNVHMSLAEIKTAKSVFMIFGPNAEQHFKDDIADLDVQICFDDGAETPFSAFVTTLCFCVSLYSPVDELTIKIYDESLTVVAELPCFQRKVKHLDTTEAWRILRQNN